MGLDKRNKTVSGSASSGARTQPFEGDEVTTSFAVTSFTPDDNYRVISVTGYVPENHSRSGSNIVFTTAPNDGVKFFILN